MRIEVDKPQIICASEAAGNANGRHTITGKYKREGVIGDCGSHSCRRTTQDFERATDVAFEIVYGWYLIEVHV
jgi:hypothetical protein